mgnify:CR=1 FL=1
MIGKWGLWNPFMGLWVTTGRYANLKVLTFDYKSQAEGYIREGGEYWAWVQVRQYITEG